MSLSELLYMTDEDLEERNQALQDFKNDMFITELEQSVPMNRNGHVNIQLTRPKHTYKDALLKNDCTHCENVE
jgi:threonyl-tRNA synthetase